MTQSPIPRIAGARRKLVRIFAALSATTLILSLASCGSESSTSESKTLTVALGLDITGLDPHLAANILDGNVLSNMYDGLFNFDTKGAVVPALATEMKTSTDGMEQKLTLREDVKFQNGDPFTSEDAKFSIDRVLNPDTATPYAGDLARIKSVSTSGTHGLTIRMKSPDPLLKNELSGVPGMILPKAYFEKVGVKEFGKKPVGTGPYQFVSQKASQEVVLKANKNFWGDQKPKLDKIVYKIVPEPATRLSLLQSGEVDMANGLDTSVAKTLKPGGDVEAKGVPAGSVLFLSAKKDDARFKNPKVMQALNYGIDKESITKTILAGFSEPVGGPMPPDLPGFEDAAIAPYPYDPDKARELIAESGEKFDMNDPIGFQVPIGRWAMASETAQAIVSDLAKIGVPLKLELMNFSAWLELNNKRENSTIFTDNLSARVRDMAPGLAGSLSCGETYSYQCDAHFDSELKKLAVLNGPERAQKTKELMQYIHDNPQSVYLWSIESVFGINSRVKWEPASATEVINLRDASVS